MTVGLYWGASGLGQYGGLAGLLIGIGVLVLAVGLAAPPPVTWLAVPSAALIVAPTIYLFWSLAVPSPQWPIPVLDGEAMDRLRIDTSVLRETGSQLRFVADEFANANTHSEYVAEAVGHPKLADAVNSFAASWDARRPGDAAGPAGPAPARPRDQARNPASGSTWQGSQPRTCCAAYTNAKPNSKERKPCRH